MLKIAVFILAVTMVAPAAPCYCEDDIDYRQIRVIEGRIASVDTFNSKIVVKRITGYIDLASEEITFSVPEGMRFVKGNDDAEIGELNVGDRVTVRYYEDKFGSAQLVSMIVEI